VCLIDGSVVVIGGIGSGPYRGSQVYKDCYVRSAKHTLMTHESIVIIIPQKEPSALISELSMSENGIPFPPYDSIKLHRAVSPARIQPPLEACVPYNACDSNPPSTGPGANAIMTPLEQPNIKFDKKAPMWFMSEHGYAASAMAAAGAAGDDGEGGEDEDEDDLTSGSAAYDEGSEGNDNDNDEEGEGEGHQPSNPNPSRSEYSILLFWSKSSIPPLLTARCGHISVATFSDSIVTAGGYSGGSSYLSSAELYVPGATTWQQLPNMHEHRSGAAACLSLHGDVIVAVAGGSDDGTRCV